MKILFIHQNFPGQFKHLAPALAAKGYDVRAMTMKKDQPSFWNDIELVPYTALRSSSATVHPWVLDLETKVIRGESAFRKMMSMKESGYVPELVIAHPGWGESLFLKDVWPDVKLGLYCEFYYQKVGADSNFDQEFQKEESDRSCRLLVKNMPQEAQMRFADAAISPTRWQADSYPEPFRQKISVVHDGIDTITVRPESAARMVFKTTKGSLVLTRKDEVITFVNRNLEPYRGYHIFMRILPELLRRRPKARVLIVGGDSVSYGAKPPEGKNWKQIFIDEVRSGISDDNWSRVHFLGNIPYNHFISLLQLSTVHVYLTYPFVLSWSLLEAMSAGCAIVASRTQPVEEVIQHGETGLLADFFDVNALTNEICALLDDPIQRKRLGESARELIRAEYDLQSICLPKQLCWVDQLASVVR
jgi:glycosyltransferase involved in cell wall biosynthesis